MTICNCVDIKGIGIGDKVHRVAALADDVLDYISNPKITFTLMKLLKNYSCLTSKSIGQNLRS